MNIGVETEKIEFKKTTGELLEGITSLASMLNKNGYGLLYFGVKDNVSFTNYYIVRRSICHYIIMCIFCTGCSSKVTATWFTHDSPLHIDAMRNETAIDKKRIYDRVFEMCVLVQMKGSSKRKASADNKIKMLRELNNRDE